MPTRGAPALLDFIQAVGHGDEHVEKGTNTRKAQGTIRRLALKIARAFLHSLCLDSLWEPVMPELPSTDLFWHPILSYLRSSNLAEHRDQISGSVADSMNLTAEQRNKRARGGRESYRHKVEWSLSYLKKSKLLEHPSVNLWKISADGSRLLELAGDDFDRVTIKNIKDRWWETWQTERGP